MSFTNCEVTTTNIQSIDDQPNDVGGMTATQVKLLHDKAGDDLKAFINTHIVELESIENNLSGADKIGATSIWAGSGNTIMSILRWLLTQIQSVVLGQIPDNTLTEPKLVQSLQDKIDYSSYGKTIRADGDSFVQGGHGERAGNIFVDRVAKAKKLTLTNSGVSGSIAVNVWDKIISEITPPSSYAYHLINVGFNDVCLNGALANVSSDVMHRIRAIIAYLRLNSIVDDGNATYTGSWTTTSIAHAYGGSLHYTITQNAYAEYTFVGDKITVGTFVLADSTGGVMEIKVDGVVKYTLNTANQSISPYANSAIELVNLGSGSHTLRVTKTDANGTYVYLDWIGIPSINPPIIYYNGITKMITSAYALYSPYNNGSDARVLAVNKAIREGLSMFDERVIFVDQSDYDPNNYNLVILADQTHPNDYGNEWLASNILNNPAKLPDYFSHTANNKTAHSPETAIVPTLLNSWTIVSVVFTSPKYWIDSMNIVHLEGVLKGGAISSVIFNLPIGYRPSKTHCFPVVSNDLFGSVFISSNGDITANSGSNAYFSLDGITFRI